MSSLIEALAILLKYGDPEYPTTCEHDQLTVLIDPKLVSAADIGRLLELGFIAEHDENHFYSFRYGSA